MSEKDEKTTTAARAETGTPSTGSRRTAAQEPQHTEPTTEQLAVDADNPPIDPRLDNRTGDQRPKLEDFPAKPQQIDGPEIGEEKEHAAKARETAAEEGPHKGAKSPGPHGLGDTIDQV
jgi:hypothetical protein